MMKRNSLGLKIFLFCELVVACRILLFEIPMFLDKFFVSKAANLSDQDRFMATVVFVSVFYLVAAVAALRGHRFWPQLHYLVTALTVFLTFALYWALHSSGHQFQSFYYLPLIYSALAAGIVFIYRECSLEKDKVMKKILIVDDDISIHKMLEPILMSNDYQVISAKTGEEGLQMAQDHKPDMIILDVILPGMKGRAVCTAIKKNSALKDVPVLFLTSKDSPDDVQAELEAGGVGHLTKPINPQYLVAQIKKVLG